MAQANRDELKSRFQTGDIPTQSDFENLIDSFANIEENETLTTNQKAALDGSASPSSSNPIATMSDLRYIVLDIANDDDVLVSGKQYKLSGADGGFTVYLPSSMGGTFSIEFAVENSTDNNVTINGNGTTIEGSSTLILSDSYTGKLLKLWYSADDADVKVEEIGSVNDPRITDDMFDAMDNANSPSESNPFATEVAIENLPFYIQRYDGFNTLASGTEIGYWRLNNAVSPNLATEMYINVYGYDGLDNTALLSVLRTGGVLKVTSKTDNTQTFTATITGEVTIASNVATIPISVGDMVIMSHGSRCGFQFINSPVTEDEIDAIAGANSPSSSNVFATMDDLSSSGGQTEDVQDALDGANAPSAANVFATLADVSSSGTNPNIFIPTLATDFTSPSASNAGKIWEIQNDITIDADCDFSACADVIFKDGGGTIDFATYNVIFNNADFRIHENNKSIVFDFSSATIDDTSTFAHCNINWRNFGLIADGDVEAGTGTDNRNAFLQVQKITNKAVGISRISGGGTYAMSVVTAPTYAWDTPTNLYITGDGKSLILDEDVEIMVLPNDLVSYKTMVIFGASNGELSGGKIIGDEANHDYTNGVSEWCHGIVVSYGSHNFKITTVPTHFSGDGLYGNLTKYSYESSMADESFTDGYDLDGDTGAAVVDTNLSYSKLIDLTRTYLAEWKRFMFSGGAYAATGLQVFTYYAVYYDDTANDSDLTTGFISKSGPLTVHDEINIPDIDATYVRLVIYTPEDWAEATLYFYASKADRLITFAQPYIENNVRQGLSNPPSESLIQNIDFRRNGRRTDGTLGSPGFHVDIEDNYHRNYKIIFDGCRFRDGANGDVILKGARDIGFQNCWFTPHQIPGYNVVNRISLTNGRSGSFRGNYVENREIGLGEMAVVDRCKLIDTEFLFTLEEERLEDNINIINPRFDFNTTLGEGLAYIRNNNFIFNKPISDSEYVFYFKALSGNLVWENVYFDLQGYLYTSYFSYCIAATNNLSKGWVDGFTMVNGQADDFRDKEMRFPAMNIKNMHLSTALHIYSGLPQDLELTDSSFTGRLVLDLLEYAETGTGDFPLYKLKNISVSVPASRYVESTNYAFLTPIKDVDIEVENMELDLTPLGDTYYGDKIMDLNHYGYTTFKTSTFKSSKTGCTIDLTTLASGDVVKFIDCEFEGVAITLRTGDLILYTKPHANCPEYADNATAYAAMGEGYYYKITSTGAFAISYVV